MDPVRLNEARKAADLSWLALADKAGISPRHMRRLADPTGDNEGVTIKVVKKLAIALKVRPGWLAFGET